MHAQRGRALFLALIIYAGAAALGRAATAQPPAPQQQPPPPLALEGDEIDLEQLLNITTTLATRTPVRLLDTPGTVLVITDEEIQRFGWRDLKEVLAAVPNLDMQWQWNWLAGGQRGFTGNFSGTLLLIDGREVQNLLADEAFITGAFAAHRIKRIEILEGPNSTLYGANAIEGVINIVTKHGPDGDNGARLAYLQGEVGTKQFGGHFRTSIGEFTLGAAASYFTSRQDWTRIAEFNANDQLYSRDHHLDQFREHDTRFFEIPEESYAIDAYAQYKGFYAGLNLFKTINTEGIETVNFSFNNHEARRGARQLFAGWKRQVLPDLEVQVEYRNIAEVDSVLLPHPQNEEMWTSPADVDLRIGGNLIEIDRHRASTQVSYRLGSYNQVLAGYDFFITDYHEYNQLDAITPQREVDEMNLIAQPDHSVFLQDTLTLWDGRVTAVAGLRYVAPWNVDPTLLPRAAVVVKTSDTSALKLTFGQGYRGPNVFESLGEALPPIRMTMVELNYTHEHSFTPSIQISNMAVAYDMRLKNGYTSVQTPDGMESNTVVSSSHRVRGVEDVLQLHFHQLRGLVGVRYAVPDREEVADWMVVKDVPRTKLKLGLSYQPWRHLTASLFVDYWSAVKTDANQIGGEGLELYVVPAWTVLHGYVRVGDIDLEGARLDLGVYAENITDRSYYHANVRGSSPIQFIQAPRNFRLQAAVSF